jgi:hypothetical protein
MQIVQFCAEKNTLGVALPKLELEQACLHGLQSHCRWFCKITNDIGLIRPSYELSLQGLVFW